LARSHASISPRGCFQGQEAGSPGAALCRLQRHPRTRVGQHQRRRARGRRARARHQPTL